MTTPQYSSNCTEPIAEPIPTHNRTDPNTGNPTDPNALIRPKPTNQPTHTHKPAKPRPTQPTNHTTTQGRANTPDPIKGKQTDITP